MASDDLLQQLQVTFLEELEERTRAMTALLVRARGGPKDGAGGDEDTLDLYRSAHNIKGAARAVGADDVQAICHRLESLFSDVREAHRGLEAAEIEEALRLVDEARVVAVGRRAGSVDEPAPTTAASATRAPAVETVRASMRVRVDRIDAVVDSAGDAFGGSRKLLSRLQGLRELEQQVARWKHDPDLAEHRDRHAVLEKQLRTLRQGLHDDADRLRRGLKRLNDEAHATRMVPIHDVWEGVERLVQDIARESGKKVEVVFGGEVTELDREVAERLREPVLQLAKNAVDHGLELPFERTASGKSTTGTVRVRAALDGDQVSVVVEDDGRGIDLDNLRERARRRGLAVPENDDDALQLVFAPGLSTAAQITDASGRGIGLDAVRHAVSRLHGRVTLRSTPQRGTRFELHVPLTLGVVRILLVRAGGLDVALPAVQVLKLLRKRPEELHRVDGGDALFFDGAVIPVVSLATLLGREPGVASATARTTTGGGTQAPRLAVVVVSAAERVVGVVVDALLSESEALLLQLPPRLAQLNHVSAMTQADSGELVPVLAVSPLLDLAAELGRAGRARRSRLTPKTTTATRRRVLVVDDSVTTRTLTRSILQSADFDVVVAADGEQGLQAASTQPFDIVISDVDMPRLDGIELTRALRATPRLAGLPVILLSALGSESDQKRGLDAGANAYLVKSRFEQSRLLEAIAQLVDTTDPERT